MVGLLVVPAAVNVLAETIYNTNGFRYTLIDNNRVSVCGWDNRNNDPVIPNAISGRAVVDIANNAFADYTELNTVSLGRATNLERIGSFAFKGCTSLSGGLTLPANIKKIEAAAFQECASLSSVRIKAEITDVPEQMFYMCDSLSSVILNSTITSIGSYAFANCQSLKYLEIPQSVTSIANTAFQNDSITLGVYTDSYAHQYAVEKGIDYILLDAPTEPPTEPEPTEPEPTEPETTEPETQPGTEVTFLLGDADGDSFVTITDVTLIQRLLADMIEDSDGMIELRSSVDGDPLNVTHATKIQRFLADIEVLEPINTTVTRII